MIWALVVVILALCGLIGWMEYNNRIERAKFLNAVVSRNANDMLNLEFADKTKMEVSTKDQPDDLVPVSELSDEEFMSAINQ